MRMDHFWAPNGSFAPNKTLFGKKLLISFSSTYWTVSFSKILKKSLKLIQIYEDVPLSDPKYSNLSWTKFFGTNHYYYFHLPIGPFHWAKFKKNSYSRSRAMRIHIFGPKWSICPPPKNFLGKLLISLSSTYYPLSLCKILMKFFHRIQSYEDAQFLGLKWPIFPNDNFFQKAC